MAQVQKVLVHIIRPVQFHSLPFGVGAVPCMLQPSGTFFFDHSNTRIWAIYYKSLT